MYANQPLTAVSAEPKQEITTPQGPASESVSLITNPFGALDPFDAYPQTRLPRVHVQRLIHGCKLDHPLIVYHV